MNNTDDSDQPNVLHNLKYYYNIIGLISIDLYVGVFSEQTIVYISYKKAFVYIYIYSNTDKGLEMDVKWAEKAQAGKKEKK